MKNALVLGAGMIGSTMARDLARSFAVTVVDARPEALARLDGVRGVSARSADLADAPAVTALVLESRADVVVGALASVLGLQTLRAVIEAGKPYVDVSFMADDALDVDAFAKERGCVCVVDCGVAPGLSNLLIGHAAATLSSTTSIEIYVGGLPAVRRWPYEYKAPFAPYDVIEEYTRPARLVEHGAVVVREALSEPELMDLPGVGTVEAFNTDGLRSLIRTMRGVPMMKEKTLRYPGHIALMRAMRETGLFSTEPVVVKGQRVVPRELTSALLFPKWQYEDGEEDLTVMRVIVDGVRDGKPTRLMWDLLDRYDPATRLRSMSRTTAYPATVVAGLLAEGAFTEPGVHAPERLGREPKLVERVLRGLEERGVRLTSSSSSR